MPAYLQTDGTYAAIACQPNAGWFGESKEKGTPFLEILFEITEGYEKGKFITGYLYLTDKTVDRAIATLVKAFGFSGDLEVLENGTETLNNKPCSIVVESETYEGKSRAKVKWINPPQTIREPMAKDKVSSLVSKFSGRAKAIAADTRKQMELERAGQPAPKPKPGLTPEQEQNLVKKDGKPHDDEDVPF